MQCYITPLRSREGLKLLAHTYTHARIITMHIFALPICLIKTCTTHKAMVWCIKVLFTNAFLCLEVMAQDRKIPLNAGHLEQQDSIFLRHFLLLNDTSAFIKLGFYWVENLSLIWCFKDADWQRFCFSEKPTWENVFAFHMCVLFIKRWPREKECRLLEWVFAIHSEKIFL